MSRHVIISNDDGIFSKGLRALADAFLSDGWRVTVCAPHQERSASAHSITFGRPLVVSPVAWESLPSGADITVYKTDGMPADCVKVAMLSLCEEKPDLVVSGINNGWNCGTDVHYSGTVGAAMEGAFEGAPAIAVSAPRFSSDSQTAYAAALAAKMAQKLLQKPLPVPMILNINIPDCDPGEIKGVVEAPMTCVNYKDYYSAMRHEHGRSAHWLSGNIVEEGCLPGGDLDCLLKGYATITALGWDLTKSGMLEGFIG